MKGLRRILGQLRYGIDFITFAKNPREITEIEAGKQRGRTNIQAFEELWENGE